MSEDYKKNLFNYLLGKLETENAKNEEIIKNIKKTDFKEWKNFLPASNDLLFNGLIQLKTSDNLVLYGEYVEKGGSVAKNSRGIIILLNNNLQPIKSIYQFNSGIKLRPIQNLIQIEDGSFVGVDCVGFCNKIARENNEHYEKRFIMLNNFTLENNLNTNNNPILRKSYIFGKDYKNFRCVNIYKNPSSAHYILIGLRYIDKGNYHHDGVAVIDLKINVGESNEWSIVNDDNTNWIYGGAYCEFNSDDKAFWEVLLTHNSSEVSLNLWTKAYDEKISLKKINISFGYYVDSIAMNNQAVFLNKNEIYFVANNERWGDTNLDRYLCLYKYNVSDNKIKTIKQLYVGKGDYNKFRDGMYLDVVDNKIYINYCANVDLTTNTADYYYQRLENDVWKPILVGKRQPYSMEYRFFYVNSNYNLVSARSFSTILNESLWYFATYFEVYNQNNYNGKKYISESCLIPNSVELYSYEDIVFARNIHNLSISENITISTAEIPNTYLNNIDITKQNLISKTNLDLLKNIDSFQKNIYETVYLNYISFLQIIDKNNGNNSVNSKASSYLNNAVNTGNNYGKTKLYNKAIIYYQNGGVKEIAYEYQNKSNNSVNIVLAIKVDDILDRLELISNDRTIVYQTIDLSNLEIGKFYNINQKVEVS